MIKLNFMLQNCVKTEKEYVKQIKEFSDWLQEVKYYGCFHLLINFFSRERYKIAKIVYQSVCDYK